ncbi:hypothetical protein SBC1_75570 (plasmid) [Caballeronia sp. SBC1]|uniref:hypothetical protein n=1 Tax=unclassified Caballeronia TaxID=2646786 RepID=UPI0013E1A983|nr:MULTISPECIES: hypothetical protein [unclassified Caballeronia]QIE30155.1 hypothetical protein SBC2_82310 [Caballeronia sp. SBC2]QIN67510.1 hypothetical protein SBC1_75570 [Caballeronia sp. SBC1]
MIGLLIAPVGFWIRNHLNEPEAIAVSSHAPVTTKISMVQALREHRKALISSSLLTASATIALHILVIYMPTFANRSLGIPLDNAFASQCIDVFPAAPAVQLHEPIPYDHAHIGIHHEDPDIDEVGNSDHE